MGQGETAFKSTPMWDKRQKLYHQRAKAALPVLVRLAKKGEVTTYQDLAAKLNAHWRNMNYPLGSIGASLEELSRKWGEKVPPIQALVVNKDTGRPGSGIAGFFGYDKSTFKELSAEKQERLVNKAQEAVFTYRKWRRVLRACSE